MPVCPGTEKAGHYYPEKIFCVLPGRDKDVRRETEKE